MRSDGAIIHRTCDEFGWIEVVENHTTRKLYFDSDVEQSCLYLNAPMTLNFEYQQTLLDLIQAFADQQQKPLRVLMLGMGGGTLAHHLYHTQPNLHLTVVELRQAVINCAYEFFQLPDEPEIDVVHANAIDFVVENNYAYDVILVDIFDAHGLPNELSQPEFHSGLFKNLNSTGLLLFNLWNEWENKHLPTEETRQVLAFWQAFQVEHPRIQQNQYNIRSSNNLILSIEL